MTPQHAAAAIGRTTLIGDDTVHMVLDAPWLIHAHPGQFIMLRVGQDTAPLLRRPISLCAVSPAGAEILFKIRGTGTARMAAWPAGRKVDIIGPLGNGFDLPVSCRPVCCVAGGIGIAPLIFLAHQLLATRQDRIVHMFLGAATAAGIDALAPYIPESCILHAATEDGTRGCRGMVTDAVKNKQCDLLNAVYYGCGPMPMLESLAGLSRLAGAPCQISLESHMACGVGACLGCTVPAHTGTASINLRVCADGPVFSAEDIFPPPGDLRKYRI